MEQCNIYCVNTEKDAIADILERNDKRIKVALTGTTMLTIVLTRQVTSQPYVGHMSGLEFETFGEME
jgi:hypothetical protein